jgi:pimeloyl-ACP methyl ester carboxylesterase
MMACAQTAQTAQTAQRLHGQRRVAFRLEFRPATPDGALACWIAQPEHADPQALPLVAVHGIRRRAMEQAALFGPRAAALGRAVVAPLFDAERWPDYQRLGGSRRADLALLALLQQLRAGGAAQGDRFELFGFSGGAQFAHRFAMLHPRRVARLSVAAAGWYTFPDAAAYPYGLGQPQGRWSECAARMDDALDDFLRLPIGVCVGARDDVRDANTRSGAALDLQQGRDRRTRAVRWAEALSRAAARRGIDARAELALLPGCGHDFRRCIERGGLAGLVLPSASRGMPPPWREGAGFGLTRHRGVHGASAAPAC